MYEFILDFATKCLNHGLTTDSVVSVNKGPITCIFGCNVDVHRNVNTQALYFNTDNCHWNFNALQELVKHRDLEKGVTSLVDYIWFDADHHETVQVEHRVNKTENHAVQVYRIRKYVCNEFTEWQESDKETFEQYMKKFHTDC